ncbi:hypothetical protein BC936DRAFT_137977, partial [Jimgerdemannia flammicorona]
MDISPAERNKYAEIFQAHGPVNGFLQDGQLDFDEFCVAMRLTYDTLDNPASELPPSLPPNLIPHSKAHLFSINPQPTSYMQPQQTGYMQPQPTGYVQSQQTGYVIHHQQFGSQIEPEFDWGISPLDQSTYEGIYSKYANQTTTGKIRFAQMEDFYQSLPISRADISAAWSLVDVNHAHALTRDQTLVFLHVLNQHSSRGIRIPSTLPAHLKAAFAGQYAADLNDRPGSGTGARKGTSTSMSTSALLADSYVNRLGVASTTLS